MKKKEDKKVFKDPEFIKKISPWILLGVLFLIYTLIIIKTPQVLTGDELFYYNQAQNIKQGTLTYFDNTQPFGFPLLLAGFLTDNIMLLRILNALIFTIGLFFLFKITAHLSNKTTGFIAILIAGLAKFSIQTSTLILTEPLFVLTTFASIWYFLKTLESNETKNYLYLGFWMILAIQTKVTNLVIPVALTLYILAYNTRKFNYKLLITIGLSLLSFLPYLILTKGKFLAEKIIVDNLQIIPNPLLLIISTIFYFTIPFFIMILFTAVFHEFREEEKIFTILSLTYIILLLASRTMLFSRHFYPFFIFLIPLISISITKQKEIIRIIGFIILAMFIIINIVTIPQLPEFEGNNYFFNIPNNCIELKDFTTQTGNQVSLPYFEQKSMTVTTYKKTFFSDKPLNVLSINYVDDYVLNLNIDGYDYISKEPVSNPLQTSTFYLDTIPPGYHSLEISVINMQNIGGMGQVIICEDKTRILETP